LILLVNSPDFDSNVRSEDKHRTIADHVIQSPQAVAPMSNLRWMQVQNLNLLGSFRSRSGIADKRRLLADYQSAARPVTLPVDRKTGLLK
jgi:hypothetical protein